MCSCTSPGLGYRTALPLGKSSLSEPPSSQLDEAATTSDLGTTSSGASVPRTRPRKWMSSAGAAPDLSGASAGAEVSSITSDYSTTSSVTFLTGAEESSAAPSQAGEEEAQGGGDEADDERSELVSEGRPAETDSESDYPVFAPCTAGGVGDIQTTTTPAASEPQIQTERTEEEKPDLLPGVDGSVATPKLEPRRLFGSHRLIECDTLSRRRSSARQKTDSESSVEGGEGGGGSPLSRALEVMKKGRSTGSLSSSSSRSCESESRQEPPAAADARPAPPPEPTWRLKITERLKFRLRASADDMFGAGAAQRSQNSPETRRSGRKKNIRRRHTLGGGGRDFAELAVIHDWREQGGGDQGAELSAVDRLKPKCSSQDFSIREWIARERCRAGVSGVSEFSHRLDVAHTVPKVDTLGGDRAQAHQGTTVPTERPSPSASPGPPSTAGEQVNGDAGGPQGRNKASLTLAADAHPHKLSGAQVVRSRFYQYL